MSEPSMHASDRDRERATEVLRDAHAAGRLALDEFLDRASAAWSARTWGELYKLTADLPEHRRLFHHGSVTEFHQDTGEHDHLPKRPFAPMWVVAASWLGIAAVAHAAAAIPLAVMALFVLWMAWRH
jgi:Domain of unknown function (DUF1707)